MIAFVSASFELQGYSGMEIVVKALGKYVISKFKYIFPPLIPVLSWVGVWGEVCRYNFLSLHWYCQEPELNIQRNRVD
jgi:hypothetical protein